MYLEEKISNIENYPEGDNTIQFMVSTDRRPINGKNRGIGLRLKQADSYLDDILLQHISQDLEAISLHHSKVTAGSRASPAPETNTSLPQGQLRNASLVGVSRSIKSLASV